MATLNVREIVLDMLLAVEKEEEYSHRIIKDVLGKYDYLSGQEKAFMKRLFEGTIERKIELDFYLDGVASIPVRKMKPLIRCLLRMTTYQILYMDGVPDAAAVSEAVKLAGKRKFKNLTGFVNGILRKIAGTKENLSLPLREKDPKGFLSVTYSMPEWIVEHFLEEYTFEETEQILEGLLNIRPVCVRFAKRLQEEEKNNLIKEMKQVGVTVENHPYVKEAYYLHDCENIALLPGYEEGAFTVQDASSMLAVTAAGIKAGDFVLDVCASPGGKTMLAAEYAKESGRVEARDVSEYKTKQIEDNIERMGLTNVKVKVWDACVADKTLIEQADVVIADVPCSGLGVIGKKRDIKYRQKKESLAEIVSLQKQILSQVTSYVKKGGTLLYSTCTINKKENEEMVEWICKEFGFEKQSLTEYLPSMPRIESADTGVLQLLPQIHDTDGFFFARLKKTNG